MGSVNAIPAQTKMIKRGHGFEYNIEIQQATVHGFPCLRVLKPRMKNIKLKGSVLFQKIWDSVHKIGEKCRLIDIIQSCLDKTTWETKSRSSYGISRKSCNYIQVCVDH
jgi:hypothetical protein